MKPQNSPRSGTYSADHGVVIAGEGGAPTAARGTPGRPSDLTPRDRTGQPRHRRPGRPRRRAGWLLVGAAALVAVLVWGVATQDGGGQPGSTTPPPEGPSGSWALLWNDEFDGEALDTEIWQPNRYGEEGGDAPFEPDLEAAWFSSSNVAVRDGSLVLTLEEDERELTGRTYPYRTGIVQSTEEYWVEPGTYVEARIQVPECDGCWPAFWLVATDRWPPEIDIFEFFGTEAESRPSFNYHPENGVQTGPTPYGRAGTDYRASSHTYGVLWDGGRAVPYVDGRAYPAAAADDVTTLPMMLILNLSVELDHQPAVGSEMLVDWVRVWQPAGS